MQQQLDHHLETYESCIRHCQTVFQESSQPRDGEFNVLFLECEQELCCYDVLVHLESILLKTTRNLYYYQETVLKKSKKRLNKLNQQDHVAEWPQMSRLESLIETCRNLYLKVQEKAHEHYKRIQQLIHHPTTSQQIQSFLQDDPSCCTRIPDSPMARSLVLSACIRYGAVQCLKYVVEQPGYISALELNVLPGNRNVFHSISTQLHHIQELRLVQLSTPSTCTQLMFKLIALLESHQLNQSLLLGKQDIFGKTPLYYAVEYHLLSWVTLLVAFQHSEFSHTSLVQPIDIMSMAIEHGSGEGPLSLLGQLMVSGFKCQDATMELLHASLLKACQKGDVQTVKCIYQQPSLQVDPCFKTAFYPSLLQACCQGNQVDCLDVLLQSWPTKSLTEPVDEFKTSLLMVAGNEDFKGGDYLAKAGSLDCIQRILPLSDVHQTDCQGWRALEHAVYRGHFHVVPLLKPTVQVPYPKELLSQPLSQDSVRPHQGSLDRCTIIIYPGSLDRRLEQAFADHWSLQHLPPHLISSLYRLRLQCIAPGFQYTSETLDVTLFVDSKARPEAVFKPLVFKTCLLQQEVDIKDVSLRMELCCWMTGKVIGIGSSPLNSGSSLWKEAKTIGGPQVGRILALDFQKHVENTIKPSPMSLPCYPTLLHLHFDTVILFSHVPSSLPNPLLDSVYDATTLIIGHRGLGMNRSLDVHGKGVLQLGENTVLSMQTASRLGADLVEFGTMGQPGSQFPIHQLSSNHFLSTHSFTHPALGPLFETAIQKCPVARYELKQHQFVQGGEMKVGQQGKRELKSVKRSLSQVFVDKSSMTREAQEKYPFKGNFDGTIQAPFTNLESLFHTIPTQTGFNIEIKYPNIEEAEKEQLHIQELNFYIDQILNCTNDHAQTRDIVYSTFHCDAAIAARLKQARYPVLFLTDGGTELTPDPRSNSLWAAYKFAKFWGLNGIVTQVNAVLDCPEAMATKFHKKGLKLVTYGSRNNIPEICSTQKASGFDAVIVDDVRKIRLAFNQ